MFLRILFFCVGLSAVAGFIVGCGNDYDPHSGVEGFNSSRYDRQADAQIRLDPRASTEMLYQAILWRSLDLPGAQGYIDGITSNGLNGVRAAAVDIARSNEFKTRIEPKAREPGGDRQILERMTFYLFGSQPREDSYVNDYKRFTKKIREGQSDKVVEDLLKEERFTRRFVYAPPTSTGFTPPAPQGPGVPGGSVRYPPLPGAPYPYNPYNPYVPKPGYNGYQPSPSYQVPGPTPNPQPAPPPGVPNMGGPPDMDEETRRWWNGLSALPVNEVHLKIYWIMNTDGVTWRPGYDRYRLSDTIRVGEAVMFDVTPKDSANQQCRWLTWPQWSTGGDTGAFNITNPNGRHFHLKAKALRPGRITVQVNIDGKPSETITITAQ